MSASSRGSRALVPLLKRTRSRICPRCASLSQSLPARRHSSTASPTDTTSANIHPVTTGLITPPTGPTTLPSSTDDADAAKRILYPATAASEYRIRAGVILSRPPILTRTPSAFERAFHLYQKRLSERLHAPFAKEFYFRAQQPATIDFNLKFNDRLHVMQREIGRHRQTQPAGSVGAQDRLTRRGRDAWDDEALMDVGELYSDPTYIRERLYTEAESRVSEDGEQLEFDDRLRIERPLGRETEADLSGDQTRLDRALDRTLYLVVKKFWHHQWGAHKWAFPMSDVRPDEGLHETAARALARDAGVNMNTWMVGRHPIAHHRQKPRYAPGEKKGTWDTTKMVERGRLEFFLKGRIMAGQASPASDSNVEVFKWLTKDELKTTLPEKLYSSVELSMPAQ